MPLIARDKNAERCIERKQRLDSMSWDELRKEAERLDILRVQFIEALIKSGMFPNKDNKYISDEFIEKMLNRIEVRYE